MKQLFAQYHDGGIIRYYNALKIKEAKRLISEGNYNMTPSEYKASIMG